MLIIPQGIPIAERRRIFFTAVSSSALTTRQTGLTGFTVRIKLPGTADVAGTGTVAEVSAGTLPGVYHYELTAIEANTIGPGLVHISKAGTETRELPYLVEQAKFGTVAAGTLTTSSFTSDLTGGTDFWKDNLVRFVTGSLRHQVKRVGAFTTSGGLITLTAGLAFTAAPTAADVFELISK